MKIQNQGLYRFFSTAMAIGLTREPTRDNFVIALRQRVASHPFETLDQGETLSLPGPTLVVRVDIETALRARGTGR